MKYAIQATGNHKLAIYQRVLSILPPMIRMEIEAALSSYDGRRLCEIHLHKDAPVMLTLDGENVLCDYHCTKDDISDAVNYLCGGSLYAHAETIKHGYIRCEKGIRAGICGKAVTEGNTVVGVSEITSINLRIPHRIPGADKVIMQLLKDINYSAGILIYSAPGVGKTTVLRETCYALSRLAPPVRFAVIDTREEICPEAFFTGAFDVFSGYPHGIGIESATRSMDPQLILCDEIGNEMDANAIRKAQNAGVPLIATVHASSYEELVNKEIIAPLLRAGVFYYCVGIRRSLSDGPYEYEITRT